MNLNSNLKLIAVTDAYHLILYEAQGLKILTGPSKIDLPFQYHGRPEKGHGSYDKNFGYNVSASDPHTTPHDIDRQNSAKLICEYLDKLFTGECRYQKLIIAADPKMLGCIRSHLSKNLKEKIAKEINKDLVNLDASSIGAAVFG